MEKYEPQGEDIVFVPVKDEGEEINMESVQCQYFAICGNHIMRNRVLVNRKRGKMSFTCSSCKAELAKEARRRFDNRKRMLENVLKKLVGEDRTRLFLSRSGAAKVIEKSLREMVEKNEI